MGQQSSGQQHDGVASDGGFLMCAPGHSCRAAGELAGRRAVVSGATGGIAEAIVGRLLRARVDVTVVAQDARRLVSSVSSVGPARGVIAGPLACRGDGTRLARRVLETAGPAELIVHQYALPTDADILDLDDHGFDEGFNPREPLFFLRELLRAAAADGMAAGRPPPARARVVLIGPSYGDPFEQSESHVRARGACQGLTGIVAAEPAAWMRANMIDPGWIVEAGRPSISPQILRLWDGVPGTPDDVAGLTMCLLSDACTGQVTGSTWQPRRRRMRQPA